MTDPIAALEVVAVTAEGKRLEIAAHIGRAVQAADGGWACPVDIAPIYPKLADIRGIDSFHATWLAGSLVLKLLSAFAAEGGKLYNADGSEFPLEAYLSGLVSKPQARE